MRRRSLKHLLRSRTMRGGQQFKGEMNIHVLWVNCIVMICLIKSALCGNIMTKAWMVAIVCCRFCLLLFVFCFLSKMLHSALIGLRMLWRLLKLHFYTNLTSAPFHCLLGIDPCMRWDTLLCPLLQNVVNKLIDCLFIFLRIITICGTWNRFKGGFLVRGNT